MARSFRTLIIGFVISALFVVSLISFTVQFETDNNINGSITDQPVIADVFQQSNASLFSAESNATRGRNVFESESPKLGFGTLVLVGLINFGKIFSGIVIGFWNILILPIKIIGFNPVVVLALTTIILISIVLLAWRVYKAGE